MFLHRIGFQTQKFNFLFILEFLSCLKAIPEVKQWLVHLNQLLFDSDVPLSKNLQSLRLFELSGTAVWTKSYVLQLGLPTTGWRKI